MTRRIAIIQGHPDPAGHHLLHAMADAYAEGASAAGHQVLGLIAASAALVPLGVAVWWQVRGRLTNLATSR